MRRLGATGSGIRARLRALLRPVSGEAGIGLVEVVAALAIFAIVSTALTDVLTSSVNAHGFATQQSLGQEAADAQIENIRSLPFDSVGIVGGNPVGAVPDSEPASTLGVAKLSATVSTDIGWIGDGVPGAFNQHTNYKQITVTVTRNSDSRVLSRELTFIAPPTRAPYGGINQVALGVTVTDIGDNQPIENIPIALSTGPSAPRADQTDSNGAVLFAGMTANPTSGATAYYNVSATLPAGYVEMTGDITQAQLAPGQLSTLALRAYEPSTIYVNLTKDGNPYTGSATVSVTSPSDPSHPQNYSVSGGSASIPGLIPNGQYTLTASTPDGMLSAPVTQQVPNNYPTDNTATFNIPLTRPNGTLSITATSAGTPLAGVAIAVTGGPDGGTLTGTTDANGVVNFSSVPACVSPACSTPYTITGTYGAATFQQTPVYINPNQANVVTLGAPTGSVAVTVKSGATVVPGATLTLTGPNGFSATGTSDGTGVYTFTNVGTGSGYAVSAVKGAGSVSQSGISVSTGSSTNVTINLDVGTIKVTVTDGTNPIVGAVVTLTGPNSFSVIGTTGAGGIYSFATVGAGSGYAVSASYGPATTQQSGLTVTLGGTTNVSLTIPTGSIKVTVTAGANPAASAALTLTGQNGFTANGTADGTGVYTFTSVPSGSGYSVAATYGPGSGQATGLSVTTGATTNTPVSISVGSVQVTVKAGTTPIQGATVTLGSGSFTAPSGTTNSSGVYTFTNVPAGGNYTAGASYLTATGSATGISVSAGSTTNQALALSVGSIKATVTLGGAAFANQTVAVTNGTYTVNGTTDATGAVTFTNVPSGTGYTISTVYNSTTTKQQNQTVTTGNQTSVALAIQAGSIKVTVKNQTPTALAGVTVTLATTNGFSAPAGTTDATGSYTFTGLPAGGGYTVTAAEGGGTVTSTSQTVTNASTTNVPLTLATGTITVIAKNAVPATLNNVSLTLNGGGSYTATGVTAGSGTYSFTLVPAGTGYTVAYTFGAATGTSASQTVTSGATTNTNLTVATGNLNVTVTAGGTGVSGLTVTLNGPNGFTPVTAVTSGTGVAAFTNIGAGAGYTASVTDGAATVNGSSFSIPSGSTGAQTLVVPVGSILITTKGATPGCALAGNKNFTVNGPASWTASNHTANGGASNGTFTLANVPAGATQYSVVVAGDVTVNVTVTSGGTVPAVLSPSGTC